MSFPAQNEIKEPLLALIYLRGGINHEMRPEDTYEPLADYFDLSMEERQRTRDERSHDGRTERLWRNKVQYVRLVLVNVEKYLFDSKAAGRAVWRLTEEGRRAAEAHLRKAPELRRLADSAERQSASGSIFPDELDPAETFREGAKRTVIVNAYERDEKARTKCLAHYGRRCAIFSFSFGEAYGPIAERVIHVHHLRPLSEVGEEYTVDPVEDLCPVCPNCHAVLHLRKPDPYSVREVQELLGGRIIQAIPRRK